MQLNNSKIQGENLVVILTITHKPKLTDYEYVSIKQCERVLKDYPKVFIVPKGMDVSYYKANFPSFTYHSVRPYWLSSYRRSNRLKVKPILYKAFQQYQHILFYEPDVFVFRDELKEWCAKDYSYIGAPWFEGYTEALPDALYRGVGNSGFSLRNVQDHIKATQTFSSIYRWEDRDWYISKRENYYLAHLKFYYRLFVGNNTHYLLNNFSWNEDHFWGQFVNRNFDWFKVPDIEEARLFSFEVHPARMFDENRHKLPFGCHAWWRYDLEFWKPHIERFGYRL